MDEHTLVTCPRCADTACLAGLPVSALMGGCMLCRGLRQAPACIAVAYGLLELGEADPQGWDLTEFVHAHGYERTYLGWHRKF